MRGGLTLDRSLGTAAQVFPWGPDGPRGPGRTDQVATEEPLEIRVNGAPFAVLLRTPGSDLELVAGLLFAEGVVQRPEDLPGIVHCDDVPAEARGNVVLATLREGLDFSPEDFRRSLPGYSGCGVCGRVSIADLRRRVAPVTGSLRIAAASVLALPGELRRVQKAFASTGGLHAAGLFDARGCLLLAREDVGRHNAVDKVVGAVLRRGSLPLGDAVLLVSGRASFEIVQKAQVAGIPVVAAVSAPSSLAVELAESGGQTLLGFVREGGFNVYCGAHRLDAR